MEFNTLIQKLQDFDSSYCASPAFLTQLYRPGQGDFLTLLNEIKGVPFFSPSGDATTWKTQESVLRWYNVFP